MVQKAITRTNRKVHSCREQTFSTPDVHIVQEENSLALTLERNNVLDVLHGHVGLRAVVDLPRLINEEHAARLAAANYALDHAVCCGELLIEAKRECRHGEWQKWLVDNFDGSDRTARAYMRVAQHRDVIDAKRQTAADLTLERALQHIAPRKQKAAIQPPPEVQTQEPDRTAELVLAYDETVAVAELLGSSEGVAYEAFSAPDADGDPASFEDDEENGESLSRRLRFDAAVDNVRSKDNEAQRASFDDNRLEPDLCAARAALRASELALTEIGVVEDVALELIAIRKQIERSLMRETKNR